MLPWGDGSTVRRGRGSADGGDQEAAQELEEEEGDDRREVEHAQGGDDPADRADDRFGHVDEEPAEGGAHPRIEPGEERASNQRDGQDGEDQVDQGNEVQSGVPTARTAANPCRVRTGTNTGGKYSGGHGGTKAGKVGALARSGRGAHVVET